MCADEAALIEALRQGLIAGAGLDVFETEPVAADNPLLEMPNVILTSHIASYSEEGDVAHHRRTVDIIMRVINGGLPERKVVINKTLYDELAAALQGNDALSGSRSSAPITSASKMTPNNAQDAIH